MLKQFKCPDNQFIEIGKCLKKCRLDTRRCAPLSYLKACASDREWQGKPSITQLLNGTRYSYLRITKDYAISPDESAFMIVGTRGHSNLEKYGCTPEGRLEFDGITGQPDEVEDEDGVITLWDYKVLGSYKIAKSIGIREAKGEYPKTPKSAGGKTPKKTFVVDPATADNWEYEMQINGYRVMLESKAGIKIDNIRMFAIARDGGTYIAESRGINHNIYPVEIPRINDGKVWGYFTQKKDDLLEYLKDDLLPPLCSSRENWDGRRCTGYCSVSDYCPGNPYLAGVSTGGRS